MRRRAALLALLTSACLSPTQHPRTPPGPMPDAGPPEGPHIRVATFNVHRFFDTVCDTGACGPGDYEEAPTTSAFEAKADQLALAIRALDAQVVVLQEVETQVCLDALSQRLSDVLPEAVLGETGEPASVDVALLTSGHIDGVGRHRGQVLTRPDGSETSFAREFLEVHLTLPEGKVVAFAAHFRSKVNDDPGRRLAEAQAAHDIVAAAPAANPGALVVLGGDLNDTPGSPPLQALESDGQLQRVDADLPPGSGTIVFEGQPQLIDHLLRAKASPGDYLDGTARVVHGSGSLDGLGGSDHAALLADFAPTGS